MELVGSAMAAPLDGRADPINYRELRSGGA